MSQVQSKSIKKFSLLVFVRLVTNPLHVTDSTHYKNLKQTEYIHYTKATTDMLLSLMNDIDTKNSNTLIGQIKLYFHLAFSWFIREFIY